MKCPCYYCKAIWFTVTFSEKTMYIKDLEIGHLLDFYGNTLPEDQRDVLTAYYFEDLSLSEIAEDRGLTRQGVRAAIKRGEKHLLFLEERLGLCGEYREREALLENAARAVNDVAEKLALLGDSESAVKLRDAATAVQSVYSQK